MKIGLLTFQDGINHGAYLQCYALYKTLLQPGNEVVIINYKNFTHWRREFRIFYIPKKPLILPYNLSKISKFHKAHKEFNLSRFTFSKDKINQIEFDVVVVGSDIVWNFKNPLFGYDPIYFGHSLNTKRLISYAPSFGKISTDDVPPDSLIEGLKDFVEISVRDRNSKNLIKKYIDRDVPVVLDPTFLYDFSGLEKECIDNNYILVYAFHMPEKLIGEIKLFAKEKGKKLLSIGYYNSWCDQNRVSVGPFEWLGYFKKADYVLTSTFHGTIFSIKYQKNFITFAHELTKVKIEPVLKKMNFLERLVTKQDKLKCLYENKLDYEFGFTQLFEEINNSKLYLNNAIKEN